MKKYLPVIISAIIVLLISGLANASWLTDLFTPKNIAGTTFPSYQVGASPVNGYYLKTNGTASTWAEVTGGSGGGTISTSSPLTAGLLVQSTAWNTIANISTSSLGLITTNVAEGTNLYYTDARVGTYITGSTTLASSLNYWTLSGGNVYRSTGNVGIGTTGPRQTLELAIPNSSTVVPVTSLVIGGQNQGKTDGAAGSEMVRNQILFSGWRDVVQNSVGAKIVEIGYQNAGGNPTLAHNADLAFFAGNGSYTSGDNSIEIMRLKSGGNVGIGTTAPDGKLHVMTASAGTVTAHTVADDLTIENSGPGGISILTPDASTGYLLFGSPSNNYGATINYSFNANNFTIGTNQINNSVYFKSGASVTALTLDSSQNAIFAGNVGIGTTAPWDKLSVAGGDPSLTFQRGVGGYTNWRVGTDTTNADFHVAQNSGLPTFYTDDRFIIKNGGNVGIGTASPGAKLDVNGMIGIQYSRGTFVDASEDATARAHIFVSDDTVGDFAQEAGHLIIQARTHTSVYRDIIFAGGINNASALMVIQGEGNVGIGTTGPGAKLDVANGQILASGTTATANAQGIVSNQIYTNAAGGAIAGISSTPTVSGANVALYGINSRPTVTTGVAVTSVADIYAGLPTLTGATVNNLYGLYIENLSGATDNYSIYTGSAKSYFGGNVGIGTTGPQAKLNISVTGNDIDNALWIGNSILPNAPYLVVNTGNSAVDYQATSNTNYGNYVMSLGTADGAGGTYGSLITSGKTVLAQYTGNVGIGTTAPGSLLEIGNTATADVTQTITNVNAGTGAYVGINIKNDSASLTGLRLVTLGTGYTTTGGFIQDAGVLDADTALSGGLSIMTRANAPIRFYVNGHTNEVMRINNDGNVGIGTTNPTTLLNVQKAVVGSALDVLIQNNDNTNIGSGSRVINFVGGSSAGDPTYVLGAYATTYWNMGMDNSDSDKFMIGTDSSVGTEPKLTITTTGNVGIGTTVPGAKLDVYGNTHLHVGTDQNFLFSTLGSEQYLAAYNDAIDAFVPMQLFASEYNFNNGNVGIGTTNPGSLLAVAGTITQTAQKSCSLGLTSDANGAINGCVASDETLKKNITTLTPSALSIIDKLLPVNYEWKNTEIKDNKIHAGFLAQDVQKIFPEAVVNAGMDENGNPMLGVDANAMISLLVKGFQELKLGSIGSQGQFVPDEINKEISALKEKLNAQQLQIDDLQKQVNNITLWSLILKIFK